MVPPTNQGILGLPYSKWGYQTKPSIVLQTTKFLHHRCTLRGDMSFPTQLNPTCKTFDIKLVTVRVLDANKYHRKLYSKRNRKFKNLGIFI